MGCLENKLPHDLNLHCSKTGHEKRQEKADSNQNAVNILSNVHHIINKIDILTENVDYLYYISWYNKLFHVVNLTTRYVLYRNK